MFKITKSIYNIPDILFEFRENYDKGIYKDLSIFYKENSKYALKRVSNSTDINSIHLRKVLSLIYEKQPKNILDVGCGTGYLIELISKNFINIKISALDFTIPSWIKLSNNFEYIEGDITKILDQIPDNQYDFVICTHVVEHVEYQKIFFLI